MPGKGPEATALFVYCKPSGKHLHLYPAGVTAFPLSRQPCSVDSHAVLASQHLHVEIPQLKIPSKTVLRGTLLRCVISKAVMSAFGKVSVRGPLTDTGTPRPSSCWSRQPAFCWPLERCMDTAAPTRVDRTASSIRTPCALWSPGGFSAKLRAF